jgi:pimeloyl-ACP methyl ester carboxylesterase
MHLHCLGSGAPTVILEAGGGGFAIDWSLVQPEIARATRVCAYDRARYGWSDPSPVAEMPANVVRDLHALLAAAGEKPPYVMVGHSMGGVYVRIFQRRYPDEVAGMVLSDPSHEDDLFTMYQGRPLTIGSLTAEQLRETLPSGDVQVPLREPQTGAPFDALPAVKYATRVELERRLLAADSSKPVPHAIVVEAVEGQWAALSELQAAGRASSTVLGNLPVVVLTRGIGSRDGLRQAHAALASSSSNGRHRIVAGAGHEIHLYQPSAVIAAVLDVLESLRGGLALR